MIEVVLAMGIVAIGMTSIMVLFPVGINASRDAVAYNTSVEMGSNLISYMQAFAKGSPNNYDGLFIGASALILLAPWIFIKEPIYCAQFNTNLNMTIKVK